MHKSLKDHNGRIWAESKGRGKGSAFFVELPAVYFNYEHQV